MPLVHLSDTSSTSSTSSVEKFDKAEDLSNNEIYLDKTLPDQSEDYFRSQSFRPSTDIVHAFAFNLRNDGKWIDLENNVISQSFLPVELKVSLDEPSLLDISDMDLCGNIFEIYEKGHEDEPLGSTSHGKTSISSSSGSEDNGIKVRWSNGRIMLLPGQYYLRIKVVKSNAGGKIGVRLSPPQVKDAPIKYKRGVARLVRQNTGKTTETDELLPIMPIRRKLKPFLIKSKLPYNSINQACRIFGGVPVRLRDSDLTAVSLYLLNAFEHPTDIRVYIGEFNQQCDDRYGLHLSIRNGQGSIGRFELNDDSESIAMEYVLCQSNQLEIYNVLGAHPS